MRFVMLFGFFGGALFAQNDQDAIRPFQNEVGPGARAMALGGAYAAIAEDYTATYWNPAGLAQIKKMEFYGSLSHLKTNNQIGYQNTLTATDNGFTSLNAIGMVFPVPTARGSLVFALGYSRINQLDDFNQLAGSPVIANLPFHQAETTTSEGRIGQWSFAGAFDLTKNVSVGGTLNIITGGQNLNVAYQEIDPNDILIDRRDFSATVALKPDYTGVNFKMGALIRPASNFRIGLTLTTPSYLSVEEDYQYADVLTDDNDDQSIYSEAFFNKYRITAPWRFEAAGSYKIKLMTLSGGVELSDWTQTRFHSDILDENGDNIDESINADFLTKYRMAGNYRVGAEFVIPKVGVKLMSGYQYRESPFKNGVEAVNSNRQFLSGGLSFLVDKQLKIDVAYQHGWWRQSTTDHFLGLDPSDRPYRTDEKITTKKLLVGFSYRF